MAALAFGDGLDADAGGTLAHRQDHGREPARHIARHPHLGQSVAPCLFAAQPVFGDDLPRPAPDAQPPVIALQRLAQRQCGGALQVTVDGCPDRQTTAKELVFPNRPESWREISSVK